METIKEMFGMVKGMTVCMWLRAAWVCIALSICNPTDDAPLWVVFALLGNLAAAVGCVWWFDREAYRDMVDKMDIK